MKPEPIGQMQRRIPSAGRIRTGTKTAKGAPTKLETFRFTSQDREAIEQIAEVYGGTVEPWTSPSGPQWQVTTEADEVRIILPPDPLGDSPSYELWSRGGRQRKCDGLTAKVVGQTSPDGAEETDTPCICAAKQEMECSLNTRLFVLLPDVKFGGGWLLTTGSEYAARELPGMVDMIQTLQTRGLTRGLLALEQRKSTKGGRTRRFAVPVLRIGGSLDELAAGGNSVGSIATPASRPELSTGGASTVEPDAEGGDGEVPPSADPDTSWEPVADGEVYDAEIVTDAGEEEADPPTADHPSSSPEPHLEKSERAHLRVKFMTCVKGLGFTYDDDVRHWLKGQYGETWSGLTDGQVLSLTNALFGAPTRAEKEAAQARFKTAVTKWLAENPQPVPTP